MTKPIIVETFFPFPALVAHGGVCFLVFFNGMLITVLDYWGLGFKTRKTAKGP